MEEARKWTQAGPRAHTSENPLETPTLHINEQSNYEESEVLPLPEDGEHTSKKRKREEDSPEQRKRAAPNTPDKISDDGIDDKLVQAEQATQYPEYAVDLNSPSFVTPYESQDHQEDEMKISEDQEQVENKPIQVKEESKSEIEVVIAT